MRKIKTTNRGKNTNKKTRPRNKVESKSPENSRSERERVGWPTGTYLLSTMTTTTTKKNRTKNKNKGFAQQDDRNGRQLERVGLERVGGKHFRTKKNEKREL